MKFTLVVLCASTIALHARPAHADRRGFTFTYEYLTQVAGGLELEFYNTQARSKFGDGGCGRRVRGRDRRTWVSYRR